MAKVAINGLGRIGRAVLKQLMERSELELVAVNDLAEPGQLAYLLRYDSAYGRYVKEVSSDDANLMVEGHRISVLNEKDPEKLPWGDMGVEIVFECTGVFTSREGTEKHLKAGAKKAMLSAPAKGGDMEFVVPGVNHAVENVFSTASCTTNCITPVVEIMNRRIGVTKAILNTVHAYTSSQAIVDGPAEKLERGRAGAVNLVPTSTGAAKATSQVLTEMKGKFDGLAVRAPLVVGSVADITFIASRPTSVEEINNVFIEESISDRYNQVVGIAQYPIVSSDIVQDPRASIIDLGLTRVVDGDLVKVMAWYDNEWGYAAQMVREAIRVAG
jgi:glyceraldehyde 3-phosphate dehydrogenase